MAKATPKKSAGTQSSHQRGRKKVTSTQKSPPKPAKWRLVQTKATASRPVLRKSKTGRPARAPKPEPVGSAGATAIKTPPLPPVKAGRNPSGLKPKDLEFFRELLLAKRRELVGDVHHMEQEALMSQSGSNLSNLPIHMADMGTDNYEQEFTLGLVEKDRQLLREINVALQKIKDGTYGICEGTGKPISRARLEAQPWARYSIEHARTLEKRMGRMM